MACSKCGDKCLCGIDVSYGDICTCGKSEELCKCAGKCDCEKKLECTCPGGGVCDCGKQERCTCTKEASFANE